MADDIDDVIFKLEGKDVVAFFPAIPGTSAYDCSCFAHLGQHGSSDLGYASALKPATPAQYADLKAELERVPYEYKLRVMRKFTKYHAAAREAAITAMENTSKRRENGSV